MNWHALPKQAFQSLLDTLYGRGYRVVGPVVRDGAVVWDTVQRTEDFPIGWRDKQEPARYRLDHSGDDRVFGVVHGPQSVKPFAFASREPLLTIRRASDGLSVSQTVPTSEPIALLGVRSCDLAGLAVQDRIFLGDAYADPYYQKRREGLFLVGVNCTRALSTCFCASMGTGPEATAGYDLVLTELDDSFIVRSGSQRGEDIVQALSVSPASSAQQEEAQARIRGCAESQTRGIDRARLPQGLYDAHEHARWDDVANRCLACTNCTMVCPTCFCHTVEEVPSLDRSSSERLRAWDSCFTPDHGAVYGKNFRPTIKDRYRQWLTHKVASWIDQFGMSGCVGCGRCITWCPVGIDITEELRVLLDRKGAA
jgi:formate hydrogenlyase subunit 6/NADH:ubiquinone oxidoreductase subunit I